MPFQPEGVSVRVETHLELRNLRVQPEKHNRRLENLVEEQVEEISDSQMAIIYALAKPAERRDDETGRHIDRTRAFFKVLAGNLRKSPGLSARIDETYIRTLQSAAPLHDIGKVGIVDNILLKPGRLSPEEFEIIKTHTTIGADTLQAVRRQYPQNPFPNPSAPPKRGGQSNSPENPSQVSRG
ncbi:MAG: HD domain-containing protein [Deltaproteobacteria bacterium]|nr:HD domain-containing protein [Deltaproteobacteria bacterium]